MPSNPLLPVFLVSLKSLEKWKMSPSRMNGLSYGDNCWCDSIELMDVAGAGYSGKHHSLWQATLYRRDSNHGLWPQTLVLIFWFSKADFAFSHRPVVEKKQPRILDQCDKCMITQRPLLSVGLWCLTGGDYWPSSPLHHTWPKVFAVSICDIFRGSRRKWSWKTGRSSLPLSILH